MYPKISIVTTVYNTGKYLEEAVLSVLNQGYPNLEYIIIDGGSTDSTLKIIKKYEDRLSFWISEKDNGMYEAVNKGFTKSSGEIMAYLNADDKYHPMSLFTIAQIFTDIPAVQWLYGCPAAYDEAGKCVAVKNSAPWAKYRYYTGDIHTIQQENIFWSRSLWEKAGSYINADFQLAGDFELWMRYFRHEKLYVTDALVGGFRRLKPGQQLSTKRKKEYAEEVAKVMANEIISKYDKQIIAKIKKWQKIKRGLYKSRIFSLTGLHSMIDHHINRLHDFPPRIVFNFDTQRFELKQ